MTDLPPGWEWATLDELVCTDGCFTDGDWVESKDQDPDGDVRLIQLADVGEGQFRDRSNRYLTSDAAERLRCSFLRPGDVLIARMPEPLGRACLYPGGTSKAVTVVDVCIFRSGAQGVDPRWLMWWMNSPAMRQRILDLQTGTTRKRISRGNLSKIPLPVPPLAEQHRIAAVLDDYLSRLSAGLSDVSRARRRVAEFWQSTLDRGIFGQSHEQNWPMSSLGQLSHGGDYGTSVKCSYDGQGAAVVRIPNILDGEVDLADMKYATDPSVDLSRLHLSVGDILFVRTNGSRSLIGRTAVVDGTGASAAFASYLIRFRLRTEVVRPRWVHHVLQSSMCRRRLEREAASSAGQYNLSLAKLESILVPVPRLSEQDSILAELNDQRYANKRLGASLGVVEVRGEALRRSLLVDAFSGRLVPQDPNDEPASLLLERIKEERAAQPQPKRGRRSTKRTHPDQESML